jgi:peptidoglycan/xylan/chitin deacetylase (PgdA/CDA1 family)
MTSRPPHKQDPSIIGTPKVPASKGYADGERTVALTFNDGPDSEIAPRLLQLLKDEGVVATFFVQGNRLKGSESIVNDMQAAGMVVGNHAWSHPDFSGLSAEEIEEEVRRTHDAIGDILGEAPKVFRSPFNVVKDRAGSAAPLFDCLGKLGYQGYSSFEILPQDEWVLPEGEDLAQDTITKLKRTLSSSDAPFVDGHWDLKGKWLLLHDGWGTANRVVSATKWLIDEVRAHGNGFGTTLP